MWEFYRIMQSHCEWPLALLSNNTLIFQVGWAIINYLFIIIAQKLCGTCMYVYYKSSDKEGVSWIPGGVSFKAL